MTNKMTLKQLMDLSQDAKDFINKQIGEKPIHEIVDIFCKVLSLLAVDLATFSGKENDKSKIIDRFEYLTRVHLKTFTQLTGIETEHRIEKIEIAPISMSMIN